MMYSDRQSSLDALQRLRWVRDARLADQAVAQAALELEVAPVPEEPQTLESAPDPHANETDAVDASEAERIETLRQALAEVQAKRRAVDEARKARLDVLTARLLRRPSGGFSALAAAVVSAAALTALAYTPGFQSVDPRPSVTTTRPVIVHGQTEAHEPPEVTEPSTQARATRPEGQKPAPALAPDPPRKAKASEPSKATRSAGKATTRPTRPVTRVVAKARPKPAVKKTPQRSPKRADPLGNLDGCGDDPLCGL